MELQDQEDPGIRNMYFAFRGDSDDVKDICIWFHSTTKISNDNSDFDQIKCDRDPSDDKNSRKLIGHTYVTVEENTSPENTDEGLSTISSKLVPNWG